jgi:hypothetical protein
MFDGGRTVKSSWLTITGPLLLAGLLLASCGKTPEKQETPNAGQTAPPAPGGEQQQAQPVQTAPVEGIAQQQSTAPTTAVVMAPLEIKLPKPMFVGTPTNIAVPNLEKPLGKARPPFLAPVGTKNVAAGKPVTGSDELPTIGELSMITDGDKDAAEGSYVELGPKVQYVTIDLKAKHTIYALVIWHFHKQAMVYHDVIVQVADDPDFVSNVRTVFNNDIDNTAGRGVGKDMSYIETAEGKLIDAKGVQGRYVRLYSRGNTANEMNHYIEVEVYGTPVK